jgi:hypothetical protein
MRGSEMASVALCNPLVMPADALTWAEQDDGGDDMDGDSWSDHSFSDLGMHDFSVEGDMHDGNSGICEPRSTQMNCKYVSLANRSNLTDLRHSAGDSDNDDEYTATIYF